MTKDLILRLDKNIEQRINKLKEWYEIKDDATLLARAIAFYDLLATYQQKGSILIVRHQDGSEIELNLR